MSCLTYCDMESLAFLACDSSCFFSSVEILISSLCDLVMSVQLHICPYMSMTNWSLVSVCCGGVCCSLFLDVFSFGLFPEQPERHADVALCREECLCVEVSLFYVVSGALFVFHVDDVE